MAFNGSGTFNRIYKWVTDLGNSVPVTASRMDEEQDGIAAGLSNCITKDGQTTLSANIPFNSKKITGLGNGSARTDSITLGQVQDSTYTTLGTTGGSANTYTAAPSPVITAYVEGQQFIVKFNAINTGASTLSVSGLTARSLKKYDGSGAKINVEPGDLQLQYYKIIDDGTDYVVSDLVIQPSNRNLIINGQGIVAQQGVTFDSTTTPANNDDTYLFDQMVLLSDGNDIVDVSQETTIVPLGAPSCIKFDVETANKKFGYMQPLEAKDSAAIIGGVASFSFKARKGGSNVTLEKLRAAIISWNGTEDSITTDVVSTWNAASANPTLAANWTYENTPVDLVLTDSFQTFKIENVDIDTSGAKNSAVFIWCDDTDATVGDLAYIGDIKLETGAISTLFKARPFYEEFRLCDYFWGLNYAGSGVSSTTVRVSSPITYGKKRTTPSVSIFNGTNKCIDMNVAFRNITAIIASEGATDTGVHMTLVVPTTSANANHTVLSGAIALNSRL